MQIDTSGKATAMNLEVMRSARERDSGLHIITSIVKQWLQEIQ